MPGHLSSIGFGPDDANRSPRTARACRSDRPDAAWPGRYAGRDHRDPGDGGARRAERAGHRSCDRRCHRTTGLDGWHLHLARVPRLGRRGAGQRTAGSGRGRFAAVAAVARAVRAGPAGGCEGDLARARDIGARVGSRLWPDHAGVQPYAGALGAPGPDRIDVLRQADRRAGRRGAGRNPGAGADRLAGLEGRPGRSGRAVPGLRSRSAALASRARSRPRPGGALHGVGPAVRGAAGRRVRALAIDGCVVVRLLRPAELHVELHRGLPGRGARLWLDRSRHRPDGG